MLEGAFASGSHIEEYFHLLACFERVFYDFRALCIHLRIVVAIARYRLNLGDVAGIEFSTNHLFEGEFLLTLCLNYEAQAT